MNRIALLLLALILTGTSHAFAQADVIIKNKAKAIRDSNNARQGIEPNQPAAPAAPGAAAPSTNVPRGIDPAQQARIDKLGEDFAAIKPGVRVSLDTRKQIHADILNVAKGMAKPSGLALTNLVRDLSIALAEKETSLKETAPAQLAHHINVIVNSMNLSSSQSQTVVIAARNVLLLAHVPEDDYKSVVTDLNAIVAELQKSKNKPQ